MYFNNNSTVVYSSTFTNFEPKNTIQIYSNSSSKIHFDSLCTTYFDDIIHIQIQSQKGLDNYSFEVFCKSGNQQNHLGWSYFASGNFNLTINYTPA